MTTNTPQLSSRQRCILAALLALAVVPFLINGWLNTLIARTPVLYWSFEMLSWLVIPGLVAWAAHRWLGVTWREVGITFDLFGERRWLVLVALCVLGAYGFYGVYAAAEAWFSRLFPGPAYFDYQTLIPESGAARWLVVVYYAVSAGVVEEILYRGALFRLVEGLRGATALYLLVSPVVFSSIHWEGGLSNLSATWVVGVFAAALFLAFRNVLPLIVGHAATDFAWFA